MKITFLGAGAFGRALAKIAEENGHDINFYDPYVYPEVNLASACQNSEIIVYVAPSKAASDILPDLPKDTPLICASKGFLDLAPFKDFKNFSVLSGAAFAKDLENQAPAFGDIITLTATSHLSEQIFSTEYLKIEYTDDILGVLLCGTLKNIYAIGAGIYSTTDFEQASDATEEALSSFVPYITTAAEEMQKILRENNADPETVKLSCGVPDLLLSCSPESRNFSFGQALGRHEASAYQNSEKNGAQSQKTGTSGEQSACQNSEKTSAKQTLEGLSALESINTIKIPDDATLIRDIIKTVKEQYAA